MLDAPLLSGYGDSGIRQSYERGTMVKIRPLDTMLSFSSRIACEVTGAGTSQLKYWERAGLVKPSVRRAHGPGTKRRYSYLDLVHIRVIKELRDGGMSLQKIRKAVAALRRAQHDSPDPFRELRLVTDGRGIFQLTDDPNVVMDILGGGQYLINVVSVGGLAGEVQARLTGLEERWSETIKVGGHKYEVVVEATPQHDRYQAVCPDFDGLIGYGDTIEEATRALQRTIEQAEQSTPPTD